MVVRSVVSEGLGMMDWDAYAAPLTRCMDGYKLGALADFSSIYYSTNVLFWYGFLTREFKLGVDLH
jgi:hypothetical protein